MNSTPVPRRPRAVNPDDPWGDVARRLFGNRRDERDPNSDRNRALDDLSKAADTKEN